MNFFSNPLRELRERLHLSREEFGPKVGLKASSIEKYESEIPPDLAKRLVELCEKHGYEDLKSVFGDMAGRAERVKEAIPEPPVPLLPESPVSLPSGFPYKSVAPDVKQCHNLLDLIFQANYPTFHAAISENLKAFALAAGVAKENGIAGDPASVDTRLARMLEDADIAVKQAQEYRHGDREDERGSIKRVTQRRRR